MTIRKLIQFGAAALLLTLAVGTIIGVRGIDRIRIGGPLEDRNTELLALMGDAMPPPIFIVRPYLELAMLDDDVRHTEKHVAALTEFEREYRARKAHWLGQPLPDELKAMLTEGFDPADRIFAITRDEVIPAARRGDFETTKRIRLTEIAPLYEQHLAAMDKAVEHVVKLQEGIDHEGDASLSSTLVTLSLVGLSIVAGVGAFAWLMLNRVAKPLTRTAATMRAMTNGDLSTPIEGDGRNDEMGEVARALIAFRKAEVEKRALEEAAQMQAAEQRRIIDSLSVALRHLANGNVSYRIEEQFAGQYEELRKDFNSALTAVGSALRAVAEASEAIQTGTSEIAQASNDLSVRTEQQAAALEETSASMTTATQSVRETADAAKDASQAVRDAHDAAEKGGRIVHDAISAMDEIEQSSKQISQIIALIDNVAFQTNLLALNAAVEAARAGEAGDGFAVVAAEVRGLAQRTADAANDVKKLITASAAQVENGVRLVGQAGETLDTIVSRVSQITGLMNEIAGSVEEESLVLVQVNAAVGEMDQMTQQNAAMVEQSTASARSLANEAVSLSRLVGNFRIDMPDNEGSATRHVHRPLPQRSDDEPGLALAS